jgi:hypothetical protein
MRFLILAFAFEEKSWKGYLGPQRRSPHYPPKWDSPNDRTEKVIVFLEMVVSVDGIDMQEKIQAEELQLGDSFIRIDTRMCSVWREGQQSQLGLHFATHQRSARSLLSFAYYHRHGIGKKVCFDI